MNWFDTTGIANLAKNALKEAQKQIDKALDIKAEDDTIGVCMDRVNPASAGGADNAGSIENDRPESIKGDLMLVSNIEAYPMTPEDEYSSFTTTNERIQLGKDLIKSKQTTTLWGSFTGSFFEHPTGNTGNVAVTKPPVSQNKRKSYEDAAGRELQRTSSKDCSASESLQEQTPLISPYIGSPRTENESSESIEILSSVATPISALTSPSQLPSNWVTQYGRKSKSSEVLDTLDTTSSVSSPKSLTASDNRQAARNKIGSMGLSNPQLRGEHKDDHDDDIIVDDASMSYTISEQPITVMEANNIMLPITVAPTRSSLHLTLSSTFSGNNVHEGTEESIDSEETIDSCNNKRPSQKTKHEDRELDRSYENVETQTQTSDSTQSFEEITPSGSVKDGEMDDTEYRPREGIQCSDEAIAFECSSSSTEPTKGLEEGEVVLVSSPNTGDDEVETTTSSDIEIISSPNGGDSSSTHSNGTYRTSPLKIQDGKSDEINILLIKKHRGHIRVPSEVSVHSGNSDESCHPESERLIRRLAEVSETLEQREYRLVELGRQNAELLEQNAALVSQLDTKIRRAADGGTDSEGYTQRLSALERKFQQSIREKEVLKQQLHALRAEEQQKVARGELDKALAERDFIIGELQKEGESLSKQVLQHSNIIKKLRVKEKESDAIIRKQRDEIGELVEEAERLKRSLSAKEEVERAQIDAVHKLSSEKQKLELDCVLLKSNLDDQAQRLETLRKSFDCARKELSEQAESYRELQHRSTKLQVFETEHGKVQKASEQMMMQLEELREQLRRTEHDYGQRMLRMKHEHAELLNRLEATEMRAEEEKNAAASLSVPLMKQLETLQKTLRHKEQLWEQREALITQQLADEIQLSRSNAEQAQMHRDTISSMQSRIANLEERLTAALFQSEETTNELLQKQLDVDLLTRDLRKQIAVKEEERLVLSEQLVEKEQVVSKLDQRLQQAFVGRKDGSLNLRCSSPETTFAPNLSSLHPSHQSAEANEVTAIGADTSNDNSAIFYASKRGAFESSPTTSIGNLSLSESLVSIPWNSPEEEMGSLETTSGFPEGVQCAGLASVNLLNNTSMLETLQATLKQRDGEVQQLQWELNRFQQERLVLNMEISNLTIELDNIREKCDRRNELEEEHNEQQKRYDALLQMYGESVEKTEELRLDLIDVKEMYKLQIDDLLRQQREMMASINSNQLATVSFKAMENSD
uniref:TATA element modulatory factor 1 TATA binding domain-containing protein n=2 Tax=Anopheles atroparvus TaxID=41427 RepID=A0AAG5DLZ4_ANOAO